MKPFLARYGQWLRSILHGDLGQSIEKRYRGIGAAEGELGQHGDPGFASCS